jgi:anti-anti-sigma factor
MPALTLDPDAFPERLGPCLRGWVLSTGAAPVYAVAGELDVNGADLLVSRLAEIIEDGDQPVVLDAAALEFADSAGVRGLLRAREVAAVHNRRLVLRAPPAPIQRVLELLQVSDLFADL